MLDENSVIHGHEAYAKRLQTGSYIYPSASGDELVLSKGFPGDSLQALRRCYIGIMAVAAVEMMILLAAAQKVVLLVRDPPSAPI
jgi:hypothetical protein